MNKEKTISKLEELGWERYLGGEYYWKSDSNRYVDFDDVYVDCYVYNNGEHFATYLSLEELNLFTSLFNILIKEKERIKE